MEQYSGNQIVVLEGLKQSAGVPDVYRNHRIQRSTSLIWEIIDNGIDEHLAGYCNQIDVNGSKGWRCQIVDHGRGIR